MLVSGFTIPTIFVNDSSSTELFTDKHCSSPFSERPLFIIPGNETRERMKTIMKMFDEQVDELTSSPLTLQVSESFSIECSVQVEISQLDGKAIKTSTGLVGAYCTCCTVTEKDAKDVERIKQGFVIDRSINELNELYMILTDNNEEDMPVPTQKGDEPIRKGLNQRPLTSSLNLTDNIPITHAYMRFLGYFEQLSYRINAGVRVMGRGSRYTDGQKARLQDAKVRFRQEARDGPLHMRLDVPDSSGHGGTSDTGEMSRTFFSQKNRGHFIDLVHGTVAEKEGIKKLHEYVSILLRVLVSKSREVDIQGYEQQCLEAYQLIPRVFPWASIPQSVHRVLAHSAERMRANDCCGLGMLSEEGLESLHKYVRRFRDILARKTSLRDNLADVFAHLWVRSDPLVRAHQRTLICSNCFKSGHSVRKCPDRTQSCENSDNAMVESFFV